MNTLGSKLPDTHAQAFDELNTERIGVEENAERLCEMTRVEDKNSTHMLRTASI